MAGGRLWTSKAHGVRNWDSWDCWDIWVHATNHYWISSTLKFSNTEVQSSNVKFPWSLESDFIVGLVCAGTCHQSKCCPPFRWFYIMYLRSRLFLVVCLSCLSLYDLKWLQFSVVCQVCSLWGDITKGGCLLVWCCSVWVDLWTGCHFTRRFEYFISTIWQLTGQNSHIFGVFFHSSYPITVWWKCVW
jgi:hypothetical protein